MGTVVYERAYYYCPHCRRGWFPTDEEFDVVLKLTPGAQEVISMAGLLSPFDEAADTSLPKLSGLNVSMSTVQRTTEGVGTDVAERREAGETFGPQQGFDWRTDAQGQQVAYVSIDATGVRQQGPKAEKAEGRMAWVGSVFNPQPTHEKRRTRRSRKVWDRRYVAGLLSLPELKCQLRRECQAAGVDQADVVIGLTDGGNGIENCLWDVLGGQAQQIEFILDFYHASEHVLEFAKTLIPYDDEARKKQVEAWCHTLKHEGGEALRNVLQALDLSRASPTAVDTHRQLLEYFRKNLHRMDYPDYVARGWQIGSGMIESACKTVVGQRLKGAGMRWREHGTTALCQLRALFKTGTAAWNAYWQPATVT